MILCDREIQALLDDGQLVIDPRPPLEFGQWSSTAVDLTLHSVLVEWTPKVPAGGGSTPPIVPFSGNFDVQEMTEDIQYARKIPIDPVHGYILKSHGFV